MKPMLWEGRTVSSPLDPFPVSPSSPLPGGNQFSDFCPHRLLSLIWASYEWDHIVCTLLCLIIPLKVMSVEEPLVVAFKWQQIIPLCGYSIVWIHHGLFIHSPVNGHLGCFHLWNIMNESVINICMQAIYWALSPSSLIKLHSWTLRFRLLLSPF